MPSYWRSFDVSENMERGFEPINDCSLNKYVSKKKLKHTAFYVQLDKNLVLLHFTKLIWQQPRSAPTKVLTWRMEAQIWISWFRDGTVVEAPHIRWFCFSPTKKQWTKVKLTIGIELCFWAAWTTGIFLGADSSGLRWNDQCNGDSTSLVALPPLLAVYVKSRGVYGHRSVASPNRTQHYIPTYLIPWYLGLDIIARCWNISSISRPCV